VIPTEDQIRAQLRDIRLTLPLWDKLEAAILETARRANAGTTGQDGYKSTHGAPGVGGGGMVVDDENGNPDTIPASIVEAMALGNVQPDEYDQQATLLFDMLAQAAASMRAVRNTQDRVTKLGTWERPAGHTAPECKTDSCDGVATRRGMCDPCRKWCDRNRKDGDVDPPVPSEVIAERTKRRAKA